MKYITDCPPSVMNEIQQTVNVMCVLDATNKLT